MGLRTYQKLCVERIYAEFGIRQSTLAVMATGLGKTHVFSQVAADWPGQSRVLVMAHREELINQAAAKLEEVTGRKPAIERAEQTARQRTALWSEDESRYVVASVQSLSQDSRLTHPFYRPDAFGLVVIDEAHHAVLANKTYGKIIRHFAANPELRILGVTATPDRADKLAMGQVFGSVAFEYGILEGIQDGYLVPITQQFVHVQDLDFSQVKTTAGDLNEGQLELILTEEKMLHKFVTPTLELAGSRPTLIFTVSVKHAQLTADIINRHKPNSALCLHGGTAKDVRREKLAEYAAGKFQYLVGCALFLEGFDCPPISCVVMARPTKSRALYAQAIGRGTRILPGVLNADNDTAEPAVRLKAIAASAKPDLLVLDFVGNSGKHKLISTADILAGKHSSEALDRARRKAQQSGRPVNMVEELDRTEEEIAEEARKQKEEEEERKKRLAEMREKAKRDRARIKALARFETRTVDPFGDDIEAPAFRSGFKKKSGGSKPTEEQESRLRRHDLWRDGMTKAEASEAIGELYYRWKNGLCSPKQAQLLRRYGEDGDSPKAKASMLIELIKARGWKRRDYPITRDRLSLARKDDGFALVVRDTVAGPVTLKERFATQEECRRYYANCLEMEPERVPA